MSASPWDRLPHPNPLGYVPRDNRTPYRIEPFEQALIDPKKSRSELGREIRARRMYWLGELHGTSRTADVLQFIFGAKARGFSSATILWVVMIFFLTAASVLYAAQLSALLILLGLCLIPILGWTMWQDGKRVPVRRALSQLLCPLCSYELTGNDVIPAEQLNGEHCGPQKCPECGTPWPLIPPSCPKER